MLRRKKDSLLNGQKLIELPNRVIEIVPCEFDIEEQAFYDALVAKVELTLNKFIKSGDMMKNYTCVMVLLLRLRQGALRFCAITRTLVQCKWCLACNHPSLVSKDFIADKEAVEPTAAKGNDLNDGDDLADLFAQMGVASNRKCQLCQTRFVLPRIRPSSFAVY